MDFLIKLKISEKAHYHFGFIAFSYWVFLVGLLAKKFENKPLKLALVCFNYLLKKLSMLVLNNSRKAQ